VPLHLPRDVEHPRQFVGRVDVGNELGLGRGEETGWRDLMRGILGAQEPRGPHHVAEPAMTGARGRRHRGPGDCSLRADVVLIPVRSKARKRGEILPRTPKASAERLAQRDVTLDIVDQHAGLPAQGWAISERRSKSTLA
jgi:hypothetical protein